jgi:hypothetical protein
MSTGQNEISTATKRLEDAQAQFDYVESRYFEHQATDGALRQAWSEREQARRALEAAHTEFLTKTSGSS